MDYSHSHPADWTCIEGIFLSLGLRPRTGGLIREHRPSPSFARRLPCKDPGHRCPVARLNEGVERQPGGLTISLFAYANPAIGSLLRRLASTASCRYRLPGSRGQASSTSINAALATSNSTAGDQVQLGALRLIVLPFLTPG